jgi:hypothetical protein
MLPAWIAIVAVVGTFVWVLIDAPKRGLSAGWAAGVLLLWIVFFPMYLAKRGKSSKDGTQTFMWVLFGIVLIDFVISLGTIAALIARSNGGG